MGVADRYDLILFLKLSAAADIDGRLDHRKLVQRPHHRGRKTWSAWRQNRERVVFRAGWMKGQDFQ